jgi:hypothetical protein
MDSSFNADRSDDDLSTAFGTGTLAERDMVPEGGRDFPQSYEKTGLFRDTVDRRLSPLGQTHGKPLPRLVGTRIPGKEGHATRGQDQRFRGLVTWKRLFRVVPNKR